MNNKSVRAPISRAEELPIKNLLKRLQKVGFKESFVREYVLPEWWDDELSRNPSGLAIAEISITRHLGVPIEAMRSPDAPLRLQVDADYRTKKLRTTTAEEILPALGIALSVAESLAAIEIDLPEFKRVFSARDVREQILQSGRSSVDLEGLLAWAWTHGIVTAHVTLPPGIKKFTGIALYVENLPIVLFGSNHDSPPWLAFHLAHELGHLLLGHVQLDQPLLDVEVGFRTGDFIDTPEQLKEEKAANAFAIEVLTGYSQYQLPLVRNRNASMLAVRALQAEQVEKIDPGTYALMYGYSTKRMGVAQGAIRELGLFTGGIRIVTDFVQRVLPENLPESITSTLRLIGIEQDNTRCLLHAF